MASLLAALAATATVATSTLAVQGGSTTSSATLALASAGTSTTTPDGPGPEAGIELDYTVEEIVVTGSRTEKRLSETPVATEVISRRELEGSGATNLAEILEKHPGLTVERSTSGVGVRLQGLEIEHVLLLVDGERVTGRFRGGIDPTRFDLENIDHIEIVKGSSSALYGSEAIGGVINIITRKTAKPLELDVTSQYGSGNTFDLSGGAGAKLGGLRTHNSFGYHRSDGYDLDPGDAASTGPAYSGWNAVNRTEWAITRETTLKARAEYRLLDQTAVDLVPPRAIFDRNQTIELFSASLGPEITFDFPAKLRGGLHYSWFRFQILQEQRGDMPEPPALEDDRQQILQASVQYDHLLFDRHLATIGAEGLIEDEEVGFLDTGSAGRQRGAVFVQDEWTISSEPGLFIVVPGVRLDVDSQFGSEVSPKLAVRFDPADTVVVRASAGFGFRAPAFEELYLRFDNLGSGYRVIGNPDLKAETSKGANLGVEWAPRTWLQLGVSAFYTDVDNLIDTERQPVGPGEPNIFQYTNRASARTDGGEAYVHVRVASKLDVDLSYAYTDTHDEALDRSLPGRARHRGAIRLSYRDRKLGLDGSLRAALVGRRPYFEDRDGDGEDEVGEPYAAIDARVGKTLFDAFTVFLGVRNLLDAGDSFILPIPPRTVYGGISARCAIDEERPTPKDRSSQP